MPHGDVDRKAARDAAMAELREALRNNAAGVVEDLLGKPNQRTGARWRYGAKGALSVAVAGADRGLWNDHAAGDGGDLFDLIMRRHGGGFPQAVAWARDRLGMPAPDTAKLGAGDRARMAERAAAVAERQAREDAAERARVAARLETVARRSAVAWAGSKPATDAHPYLKRKGVDAEGLRLDRRGRLRVPMRDADGELWSLQTIDARGTKLFPRGGRVGGTFFMLGEPEPGRPVAFAEGVATGKSVRAISGGLPVAVALNVGNKERVMREWRERHPDQTLVDAADNDHGKPRNAGAEMAARLERDIGAVPALPPWKGGEAGTDWNDYRRTYGHEAAADAFRGRIEAAVAAAGGREPKPDGTPHVPAAASPPTPGRIDPRRVLTEAMAVEGVRLGMSPAEAVRTARAGVAALDDAGVRDTLASMKDRGWAMREDGTLEAGVAPPKREPAAPTADAADPARALLAAMRAEAGGFRRDRPDLAQVVDILAERAARAGALAHAGLRTRIAYAAQDVEKETGRTLPMPEGLRAEMTALASTAPGLQNERMRALVAETASIQDAPTVAAIRRAAADLAKQPGDAQRGEHAMERVEALERRVRLRGAAPDPDAWPDVEAASPGPGQQNPMPEAAPPVPPGQGAPRASAPPTPAPVAAPIRAGAVPPQQSGQPPRTIAGQLLSAMRIAPPAGPPPWHAVSPGMGERLTDFEAKMAEGRTARLFDQAEQAGAAALAVMERFARGQGAPLLGRIEKAAAGDDLAAVVAGMVHGGPQAALRAEFDRAMDGDRRFADAYREMKAALQMYGEARLAAGRDAAARGLPSERLAGLERMDAALGEAAAKVPGEAPGRSLLEQAGAEVAEVLREAADKVAAAVASAAAGVKAKFAGAAPGPSPSA